VYKEVGDLFKSSQVKEDWLSLAVVVKPLVIDVNKTLDVLDDCSNSLIKGQAFIKLNLGYMVIPFVLLYQMNAKVRIPPCIGSDKVLFLWAIIRVKIDSFFRV